MIVVVEQSLRGVTLQVRGELDLATAVTLRHEIARAVSACDADVEIDLSEVAFVDCAGLRALLLCVRSERQRGRRVSVTGRSPSVARLSAALGTGRALEAA